MIHLRMWAHWVLASPEHAAATLATVVAEIGLALIGSIWLTHWVWRHTRDDVLWMLGWARRRHWNRSTSTRNPPRPMSSVGPAVRTVRDTFGPVAREESPKRVPQATPARAHTDPGDDLFAGPSARDFDQQVEDMLTIANRFLRGSA